jgi:uncharacterized protein YqeY
MSLKAQIQADMKDAMRARAKERLSVIRMLLAAIQMREIEDRNELTDAAVLGVVEKLIKQRKDSAKQFADAGRADRQAAELSEAEMLQAYLPEQLNEAEISALISDVISATGASGIRDMGKVMAAIRDKAQGRADMGSLSALVKAQLGA